MSGELRKLSQWILSHCLHVKECFTPATSGAVMNLMECRPRKRPGLVAENWSCARRNSDGSTSVNCHLKLRHFRESANRLIHSDQNGTWGVEQEPLLSDDRTHPHRSTGRTLAECNSTPGTMISPLGSLAGNRSKRTVRNAEFPSGYRMLEKANAYSNMWERGSRFAPHRKVADFQQVLLDNAAVKGLHYRER